MKFLVVLAIFGFGAVFGEAPAQGYAPRGWRPDGPSFDLPTETIVQDPVQSYGAPEENADVEVTQEEVQYSGELPTTEATTPFLKYGVPAADVPSDVTVSDIADVPIGELPLGEEQDFGVDTSLTPEDGSDLSVQGLPGTEPAQEFRVFPGFERFTARKNPRFNARLVRPAKIVQQRQRFTAPSRPKQFSARLQAPRNFANIQQFGRLTAPTSRTQRTKAFNRPTFQRFTSQRQVALDSYGAPAETQQSAYDYVPPAEPALEYGVPAQEDLGLPPQDSVEPEFTPELTPVEDSEATPEIPAEDDAEPNIAISNSVASARYKSARFRSAPKPARLQQRPLFTYDRTGRLIRIN